MKKTLLPLLLLLFSSALFAQTPPNDDCGGIIDLGTIPLCPDSIWYTNVDATESSIGTDNFPSGCDGGDFSFVGRDVWFQFNTNDTLIDINIEVTGINDPGGSIPMSNPQVALYRGDCSFDNLSLVKCGRAGDGENIIDIDVIGLDPNTTYFLRINDWSNTASPNSGTFQLCIGEQDPIFTVCGDGSIECTGILYDCGGPDDDYGNNENETFTICPEAPMNECITFNLEYYNIEEFSDFLTFYDGPDSSSPVIGGVGGGGSAATGGGGVCYTVQASSGCLTVGFSSDVNTSFEGFCGAWECSAEPCDGPDPISVDETVTGDELAEFVTTAQTIATITNIDCAQGAYGTFTGDGSNLGLDKGIILTSGSIDNAVGPNNSGSSTVGNGFPGDMDLDSLSIYESSGQNSNDACVVELDVFVTTNELSFEYIFGSEEYPEFVNSFNDIFALLVSGPGVTGPSYLNNQLNVAVVPGTNTPVEVNTINNDLNWEYYRSNTAGPSVEYDGLTSDYLGIKKSLSATIPVIPCTTYHLKFAIADRGDSAYDSGVFIAELKGGVPKLTVNFASGVDYLVENCTGNSDVLLITLDNPLPDTATYDVNIGGTATLGLDYTLNIPSQIVLDPGETQLAFPLIPLSDVLIEGIETITITLTNNFGCGDVELNSVEIEIHDLPLVEIFAGADTIFACEGECLQLSAEGGAYYEWGSEEAGIFDDPDSQTPLACPTFNQWVYVEGFISSAMGCSDVDSVFLSIVDPQVIIVPSSTTNICVGESVQLVGANNVGNANIMWTPDDFLDADDIPNPTATPPVTTTYTVSVDVAGCIATDMVTVNVDPYDPVNLTSTDTTICQGSVLQLADSIPNTTTTYEWTPTDYIITDTDIAGAVSIPEDDIVYTVISTSEDAYCADTLSVNVTVLPALVEIEQGDYFELCLGDSINLTALNSTNGVGITWSPDINLDTLEGGEVWATPTETTEYFVTLGVGQCSVVDSITIRVDSLPDLSILPIPDNNPFCQGEIIALTSTTYNPGSFPDLEHVWTPTIGAESDTLNFNLVITATETFTYVRYSTNHACVDTSSIEIIVIDPNDITLDPMAGTICEGDTIQLSALSPDTDEFTWSPSNSLSCEECPDPIASPTTSQQYLVEAEVMGCPIMGIVSIVVEDDPYFSIPNDPHICLGESIELNANTDPDANYSWTSDPPGFTSTESQPTVTPSVTTTYTLTVDNEWCNPLIIETIVYVDEDPAMTVNEDEVLCVGQTISLVANGNTPDGDYTWNPGGATSQGVAFTAETPGTFVYYSTFTNGCGTVQDSVIITVIETISVSEFLYSPDLTEYFEGDEVTITAVTNPANPVGATYNWMFNNQPVVANGPSITVNFNTDPADVSLTVTSAEGCAGNLGEDSNTVIELDWEVPNAFTPDADGFNDYFDVILSGDYKELQEFKIFNRWGAVVYDNDTPGQGWDGTYKGKPAASDVYIYRIVFERQTGEIVTETGDLTLIR